MDQEEINELIDKENYMIFKANYKTGSKFSHKQMENIFSMQDLIATVMIKVIKRPAVSPLDIVIAMHNQMVNINNHLVSDGDLFLFVISLKNGEKFTCSIGENQNQVLKIVLENPMVKTVTTHLKDKEPGYIAILPDVFNEIKHSSPDITKSIY